jgi:hypothetical protein
MSGLKRFILWDYRRASWQYDVMVGLILAFIFLTPKDWFRDQPRAGDIVMLPAVRGVSRFWIAPEKLANVPDAQRTAEADQLLNKLRPGRKHKIVRLEPIVDSEREIKGYIAVTQP